MDCIWASEIGEVGSKPYVAHTKTANYLESITGEALCEEFVFFIAEINPFLSIGVATH